MMLNMQQHGSIGEVGHKKAQVMRQTVRAVARELLKAQMSTVLAARNGNRSEKAGPAPWTGRTGWL